jgi:hypothetical protein
MTIKSPVVKEVDENKHKMPLSEKNSVSFSREVHTARIDMAGNIVDMNLPSSTPSDEEDKDHFSIGESVTASFDEEATHPIGLPYKKKKKRLKRWRIWNYQYKMLFMFFVIMLVFLALTLYSRSQLQDA